SRASIANIWKIVLYLPSSWAGTSTPPVEAMPRSPVTASSRTTMSTTIQAGTRGSRDCAASMISTAATTSLSASGSRNWPSAVVLARRRASQPSRKSVKQATRKTRPASPPASVPGREHDRSRADVGGPVAQHTGQVLARLDDRRHAAGILDALGPGVVRGDHERQVSSVPVEQHAQMAAAAFDVVARQEHV